MTKLQISVCVPAFNAEQYLDKALYFVKAQTVKPYEIIVLDDGSTDDTKKIALEYTDRVISLDKNQGIGNARRILSEEARGENIAFLSADDCYDPNFLQVMSRRSFPAFCNYFRCDEKLKIQSVYVAPLRNDFIKQCVAFALDSNMFVNFSTVILPKSMFYSVNFKNLRYGEDLVFLMESLSRGWSYWNNEPLPLVYYRIHQKSGTQSGWNPDLRSKMWQHLSPALRDLGVSPERIRAAIKESLSREHKRQKRAKLKSNQIYRIIEAVEKVVRKLV